MSLARTVFILGAGASKEVDMPIGSELAARIATRLDIRFEARKPIGKGDHHILALLGKLTHDDIVRHQQAGWAIRDGIQLANSIDDFLDLHQADESLIRMGKLAIVRSILHAERYSHLYFDQNQRGAHLDLNKVADTWFVKLIRWAHKGKRNPTHLFENIAFINFNYDRCLEHFLVNALRALYRLSEKDSLAVCKDILICHPYGTVGALPQWEGNPSVAFGDHEPNEHTLALAENIQTYTEENRDKEELERIKSYVESADHLVFLGFGFHAPNMALLKPMRAIKPRIYVTAHSLSEVRRDKIRNDLASFVDSVGWAEKRAFNVHIADLSCSKLFDEYVTMFLE